MICKLESPERAASLFAGWDETMIFSCLQGVMGEIYADDAELPRSAMAILDDFAFFAGAPDRALVSFKPKSHTKDFILMVPQSMAWEELIREVYGERCILMTRYAIRKEPDMFDRAYLTSVVDACPPEFALRPIDESIFLQSRETAWMRDWTSAYADYDEYRRLGMGVVLVKGDEIIAGASAYSRYREGIEIQIDTREPYRRRGFALICGARLILDCLDRGLYPSWDAANLASVALAEKLGYHFDREYIAYGIQNY